MAGAAQGVDARACIAHDLQVWGSGRWEKPSSLRASIGHGVACPFRASTMVSRSCVCGVGGVLQGGGDLFGSRRPSDNWKVPVLSWPSVPLCLAPVLLLLTTEGPAVVCSARARSLARRAGRAHLAFVYPRLLLSSCAVDKLPGA